MSPCILSSYFQARGIYSLSRGVWRYDLVGLSLATHGIHRCVENSSQSGRRVLMLADLFPAHQLHHPSADFTAANPRNCNPAAGFTTSY